MHHRQLIVRPSLVVLCAVFAVGCAATPPREAIPQESKVGSPPIIFAGSYDVERTKLTITANEQPVMRGTFPPFTPVLNLNSTFDGQAIRAECYFSSVLSESGGLVGIISSAVQNKNAKTSDTCLMKVEGLDAANLNF